MAPNSSGNVRRLEARDVPQALQLSNAAGWNQTQADWQAMLDVGPDGCFAIDGDDGLAATATLVSYGKELGWLGMVLTRENYQRRGFARRLVTAALEYADQRGVRTVKLDATAQGRPLYESFGFQEECSIERWARASLSDGRALGIEQDDCWEMVKCLDYEAFGVRRTEILASFRGRGHLYASEGGFAMARPGSRATYMGPIVAQSASIARGMIRKCLAQQHGLIFWDLLPGNPNVVALAQELGFRRERSLTRMSRGQEFAQRTEMIYGITGFEFG